ncbi:Do family serine endopeptidase [bacterium]|nr:Do family serine endopeptidase [bacterium]
MKKKLIKRLTAAGLIFIGVVVGIVLTSRLDWTPKSFASNAKAVITGNQSPEKEAVFQMQNTGKAFTYVAKEILPTVVSISSEKVIKRSADQSQFGPLFRDFFGREFKFNVPKTQKLRGLGSGVIVSKDGYILTNNHVIEDADDITVTLNDKRSYKAKIVGRDPLTEVAVIKIDGSNLPAARLGNSDAIEVGEWVLAVGNPLELNSTITAGIISAKGRDINIISSRTPSESGGSYAIENFIQTDAAINPGNSGGALVNLKSEVIGINTAIATKTGGYQGYGFAVPINLARKIMNDLIKQGYVTRAYLGIGMRNVDEAVAERFNLSTPKGVYVDQVVDGSPAQKAGLKPLDIITKLDGKEVSQGNEIQSTIALKNPGDTITLTILRDGKIMNVKVKLGKRDTGKTEKKHEKSEGLPDLGISVQTLDNDLRSQIGYYDNDEGVVVTGVEPYSTAFDAGIVRGDLITKIESSKIKTVNDYKRALRQYKKRGVVIFSIKRKSTEFHAFVKMSK